MDRSEVEVHIGEHLHLCNEWGQRCQAAREATVKPGGQLERDAQGQPGPPLAGLAWRSLAQASENLGFIAEVLHRFDGGIFERPFVVVGRAALLGMARSVYLLHPDDANERRKRALTLMTAEARYQLAAVETFAPLFAGDTTAQAVQQQAVLGAQETVTRNEDALESAGEKRGRSISDTELVTQVASLLDTGGNNPALGVRSFWQEASGAAHAMSWHWTEGNPVRTLYEVLTPTVEIGKIAWCLWEDRRSEP